MPIYEYECSKCGVIEITQRITDDSLKRCPTCHHKVQKLISNTSFQLKGTGWYITDYGRGSGANGDKSGTEGKSSEGKSGTEGKSSEGKSGSDSKSKSTSESSDSSKKASDTNKSSGEKSTSSATPS